MVNLTVVFESLTSSGWAASDDSDCVVLSSLLHGLGTYEDMKRIELVRSFEHGLDLLLAAADLELEVRAVLLLDASSLSAATATAASGSPAAAAAAAIAAEQLQALVGEALIKKLGQLELYDIPCQLHVITTDSTAAASQAAPDDQVAMATAAAHQLLPFFVPATVEQVHVLMNSSSHIITV